MRMCCGPAVSGGVVTVSVFMSTKVAAADFPPMVTVAPDWKPLPRMVRVAPPEAGADAGEIGPMANGAFASLTMVGPEGGRAKILLAFSCTARKNPGGA